MCLFYTSSFLDFLISNVRVLMRVLAALCFTPSGLSSLLSGTNNLFLSPLMEKNPLLTVLKSLKRIKSNYKAIYAVAPSETSWRLILFSNTFF